MKESQPFEIPELGGEYSNENRIDNQFPPTKNALDNERDVYGRDLIGYGWKSNECGGDQSFLFLEFENGRIFADYLDGCNLSILHEK